MDDRTVGCVVLPSWMRETQDAYGSAALGGGELLQQPVGGSELIVGQTVVFAGPVALLPSQLESHAPSRHLLRGAKRQFAASLGVLDPPRLADWS